MDALDVVANNLANVNTTGFRGQHEFYEGVIANAGTPGLSPLNVAINNYGVLGGADLDLQQGSLVSTGNNLDLGIRGSAFFAVQTPRGIRYTRNGSFHVSAAGQIVTQDEDPVLGPTGPIQVPPGTVEVASDGTLTVANNAAGQIRLASFAAGTDLVPEGNTNFIAPDGAEQAGHRFQCCFGNAGSLKPKPGEGNGYPDGSATPHRDAGTNPVHLS